MGVAEDYERTVERAVRRRRDRSGSGVAAVLHSTRRCADGRQVLALRLFDGAHFGWSSVVASAGADGHRTAERFERAAAGAAMQAIEEDGPWLVIDERGAGDGGAPHLEPTTAPRLAAADASAPTLITLPLDRRAGAPR